MFQKAVRSRAKLKMAVAGPSGSGKTYSALAIATGLGGKIALIDTENARSRKYSHLFEFDTVALRPPFRAETYVEAINAAVAEGYATVIVDSISHLWAGEGGLLEQKEKMDEAGSQDRRYKNQGGNWRFINVPWQKFISALLQSDINLIATMRSKQDYVIGADGSMKKIGMAPIARPEFEYEFDIVFSLDHKHECLPSMGKNTLLGFDGKPIFDELVHFRPSPETGQKIKAWLDAAPPVNLFAGAGAVPEPPADTGIVAVVSSAPAPDTDIPLSPFDRLSAQISEADSMKMLMDISDTIKWSADHGEIDDDEKALLRVGWKARQNELKAQKLLPKP